MKPDEAWEVWGREEPYFAVLTHEQYLSANLTDEQIETFFESGRHHISDKLSQIDKLLGVHFVPRCALDFGCGNGRALVALTDIAESVIGVDVSKSVLAEAQRNCEARGRGHNWRLMTTAAFLDDLALSYNFLHSHLVFQHIRRPEGERLLRILAERLDPGGVLSVDLLCSNPRGWVQRAVVWLETRFRPAHHLVKWLKGERHRVAPMEMNTYGVEKVSALLAESGVRVLEVSMYDEGALRWATYIGTK